jgi:predicted transglutaminase-like cysteine proteinase
MATKFNIELWAKYYHRVDAIGSKVKQAVHDQRDHGFCDLTKTEMENMIEACNEIVKESAKYMDDCGLRGKEPLWVYSAKDETTWASSPLFAYGHLVKS